MNVTAVSLAGHRDEQKSTSEAIIDSDTERVGLNFLKLPELSKVNLSANICSYPHRVYIVAEVVFLICNMATEMTLALDGSYLFFWIITVHWAIKITPTKVWKRFSWKLEFLRSLFWGDGIYWVVEARSFNWCHITFLDCFCFQFLPFSIDNRNVCRPFFVARFLTYIQRLRRCLGG